MWTSLIRTKYHIADMCIHTNSEPRGAEARRQEPIPDDLTVSEHAVRKGFLTERGRIFAANWSTICVLLFLAVVFFVPVLHAQEEADSVRAKSESMQKADTAAPIISGEISKLTYQSLQQKSPTGALLRSLAIPGWGQLYNRKYIKAIVVAGLETFLVVEAVRYWDLSDQAYDLFSGEEDPSLRLFYYYDYDFYRDRRNLFLYFSGVTIFLSMIDAYVDAHLQNFDVDITPSFDEKDPESIGLKMTFTF